jgi:selenocysteine lyase/cysteine desulfurase
LSGPGGDGRTRPSYDLEACRAGIPVLAGTISLANCSHAPQTDQAREAMSDYLDSWGKDIMDWDAWMEQVTHAKAEFAALIHATPEEVAMLPSVTAAAGAVASALNHRGRRNRVVLSQAEFPTVGHVWLARERHGADVRWIPVRDGQVAEEEYAALLDDRTQLVCACHAYYQNGSKQDVGAIARQAHDNGALIFVDAYQTLGLHCVDVRAMDVDFLTSGAHKYLMGVPGIAFLYVKKELIDCLEPAMTGWFGREDIFAFDPQRLDWAPTANRFEMATPPVANAYVARAGMSLIRGLGPQAIQEWTDSLSARLIDGGLARGLEIFGPTDVQRKTSTTAFICPDGSDVIEKKLRQLGIQAAARGRVIRLAPHYYNSIEDIETALDALAGLLRSA